MKGSSADTTHLSTEKPTVVFFGGAFHTAGFFDPIIARLKEHGYPAQAISRPTVGAQAHDSSIDPFADQNAIRSVLQDLVVNRARQVVLACHSAGGSVGSRAVKGFEVSARESQHAKGGIVQVCFLSAFLLPEGGNIMGTLGQSTPEWVNDYETFRSPNDLAAKVLFSDMEEAAKKYWASKLQPQNKKGASVKPNDACWDIDVPKAYLFTTKDKAMPLALQERMLESVGDGTWLTASLDAGHESFLSCPDEVAKILIGILEHEP